MSFKSITKELDHLIKEIDLNLADLKKHYQTKSNKYKNKSRALGLVHYLKCQGLSEHNAYKSLELFKKIK